MRCATALASIALLPSVGIAATLQVPSASYPTIQAGIDAANPGDEVVVLAGTYFENIDFRGRSITVRSAAGAASTTIDGNQMGSVVTFKSGETPSSVLRGFTIQNGNGTVGYGGLRIGGGIYVFSSSPLITDCIIRQNKAEEDGGGIYCDNFSAATVERCIIRGNEARYGAGFYSEASSPLVSDCVIEGNTAMDSTWGGGGGIACDNDPDVLIFPTIENCIIIGNTADGSGGGLVSWNSRPRIINCTLQGNLGSRGGGAISCQDGAWPEVINSILWGNVGATGPEIWLQNWGPSSSAITISYSDVQGGQSLVQVESGCTLYWGVGMIDANPLFFDPGNEDFRLGQDPCQQAVRNPCVDKGNSISSMIERTTRTDWVEDSGVVDMGYHYTIPAGPGTGFCFGDNSATPCPCSNLGGVGEGCANSSAAGGVLAAHGSASVTADDLGFTASNLLPGQAALLFSGLNAVNGGAGLVFGDGLRCAGGGIVRLGIAIPGAAGGASWGPGLAAAGNWSAGDTRHFQGWYRDPSASPCTTAFNLTHGVSVTFTL